MGVVFAILSAVIFAVNNVIVKKGIRRDPHSDNGLFITVLMNVILLGVLCLIVIGISGWNLQISWKAILFFAIAGLCTTGVGRLTLFSSISYIGPSKASAIRNSTPIFTTVFALLFLGEEIALLPGIGMLLLLGGLLNEGYRFHKFEASNHTQIHNTASPKRYQYVGFGLALFSAIIFGMGQGIRKQGLIEMNHAFFGAWVGTLASLVFVIIYQCVRREFTANVKKSFAFMNPYYVIAGVLTSLGPLFFFLAAQTIQVSYVSVIAAAEPLITVLISAVIFRGIESITMHTWVTITMMFFGTTLLAIYI
ncbi:DMT family transporter [Priestia megaterium]|nr:DMT family transporter [Priestia megaterium]